MSEATVSVNWTPDSLLQTRDRLTRTRTGVYCVPRLYASGWELNMVAHVTGALGWVSIGRVPANDVWSACGLLNDMQAQPVVPEPGHADDCPMNDMLLVTRGYDMYGHPTCCQCGKTPETPAVSAEPAKVTADRYFDRFSRLTWLDFGGRIDDELAHDLGASGWRWSRYRKMWRTNRRFPELPKIVEAHDQGEVHFAEERAGRLRTRAQRTQDEAQARWDKAHQLADMIPLGQPILVGHHSEGRHRRDLARIETNSRKAIAGFDEAKELSRRAEASEAHQAWKHDPGAIKRRIDRLEAEERRLLRNERGWGDVVHWRMVYDKNHGELEAARAELEAAGGIPADKLDLRKGMFVIVSGQRVRIDRVNAKTLSVTVMEGGAKGWTLKIDRSRVMRLADEEQTVASTEEETPHA